MTGDRTAAIAAFLAAHGWDGAARRPLADDASFRRYERLVDGTRRAVLMDAPPPREDVRPFLAVDAILRGLDLSAPEIYAADADSGLLLLEDFGDDTYTRVLAADSSREGALYALAVDVLIALRRRFTGADALPPYDDDRLLDEANLLLDWYLPEMCGKPASDQARHDYIRLWRAALAPARAAAPPTLVLRDYHVDNLVWLPGRAGVRGCGLLDFQDAVLGPPAYDLVSLLEDARRDVPGDLTAALRARYLDAFPDLDRDGFDMSYAVLGAQRSAKILGIFTRLARRDGKPGYLAHLPRVWRWLEGDLRHPALAGLRAWFARELPPSLRVIPES